MPSFYWNPHLETGNKRVDGQHRHLIDLTNRLADAVTGHGRVQESAALLDDLTNYAREHFRDEEELMSQSAQSPKAKKAHISAHRNFVAKLRRIAAKSALGEADTAEEILEFLVTWLVAHILDMDHQMIRALPDQPLRSERIGGSRLSTQRMLIAALTETERRFRLLAEQAPALIWICGPTGDRDFVNRRWLDFVGRSDMKAADIIWADLMHIDDRSRYAEFVSEQLSTHSIGEIEYRVKTAGGAWRWVVERVAPRMEGERCVGLIAVATDITAIKETTDTLERLVEERTSQLKVLANTDPLTGLLNRRALTERLEMEINRAQRYDRSLSILFCDIDHFKVINDRYGHSIGDEVLLEVARVISGRLSSTDFSARFGGEEFVIALIETGMTDAFREAEKLRRLIGALEIDGIEGSITISIGVTTLATTDDRKALIARADAAMYAAKQAGRNCSHTATAPIRIPFDLTWSDELDWVGSDDPS